MPERSIKQEFRPVPTRPICHWPTRKVGRRKSPDSSGFRILNMFNRESLPIITESVFESAVSVVELADSTADSSCDLARIGVWLRAFRVRLDKGYLHRDRLAIPPPLPVHCSPVPLSLYIHPVLSSLRGRTSSYRRKSPSSAKK